MTEIETAQRNVAALTDKRDRVAARINEISKERKHLAPKDRQRTFTSLWRGWRDGPERHFIASRLNEQKEDADAA